MVEVRTIYTRFNSNVFSIIGVAQELLPNKKEIQDLRSKLSAVRQEDPSIMMEYVGPMLYEHKDKIAMGDVDYFTKGVDWDNTLNILKKNQNKQTIGLIDRYARPLINAIRDTLDQIDDDDKKDIMTIVNDLTKDYCRIEVYKTTGKLM